MTAVNLSTRIRFVNDDGTLTQEAYRSLTEIINRTGGVLGNSGSDTFVSNDYSSVEAQQSAGSDITGDTFGAADAQAPGEIIAQAPSEVQALSEMVMQPVPDRAMTAPETVTVGASPFVYQASRDGYFIVTGGTVSKQEYGRGATFTDVGLLTSMLPILLGDALRVAALNDLGLLDNKMVNILATRIPFVGSFTAPALNGLRETAGRTRNNALAKLLANPDDLAKALKPGTPQGNALLNYMNRAGAAGSNVLPVLSAQ